jgi:hypothetical protein
MESLMGHMMNLSEDEDHTEASSKFIDGDFDGAIVCLQRVIERGRREQPPDKELISHLLRSVAEMHIEAGRNTEAVESIEESVNTSPVSMMAAYESASILKRIPNVTDRMTAICMNALTKLDRGEIDPESVQVLSMNYADATRKLLASIKRPKN